MCVVYSKMMFYSNYPLGSGVSIIFYKVMKLWEDSTFLNLLNSIDSILFTQVERAWENEICCHRRSGLLRRTSPKLHSCLQTCLLHVGMQSMSKRCVCVDVCAYKYSVEPYFKMKELFLSDSLS